MYDEEEDYTYDENDVYDHYMHTGEFAEYYEDSSEDDGANDYPPHNDKQPAGCFAVLTILVVISCLGSALLALLSA